MKRFIIAMAITLTVPVACFAGDISAYKITFKTLSCTGTKGMGSIDADNVVKIQSIQCDAGDPVKEVYQLIVNAEPGAGTQYRVFTVTEEEAAKIQRQVDEYQSAKSQSLKQSERIIINQEVGRKTNAK